MKALIILLSLMVALVGTVPISDATPIEFVFTGVVVSAEPEFPTVHPGDIVIGKYLFESTTPDSNPDPGRGVYFSAGRFEAKIGELNFDFPLFVIEVLHLYGGNVIDRYTVAAISGNVQLQLFLLDDVNPTAFKDDSLPLVPPPLTAFYSKQFLVFVSDPSDSSFITKIDANLLTLVAPEPSALLLLMTGLAFLMGMAGWRKSWDKICGIW